MKPRSVKEPEFSVPTGTVTIHVRSCSSCGSQGVSPPGYVTATFDRIVTNSGYARWHVREGLHQQPVAGTPGTLLGCTATATLQLQNPIYQIELVTKKGCRHWWLHYGVLEQERGSDIDAGVYRIVKLQQGSMTQSTK